MVMQILQAQNYTSSIKSEDIKTNHFRRNQPFGFLSGNRLSNSSNGKFSHSHRAWLREHVCMNVHHQVSSCCVLHDETHVLLGLETSEEVHQERMSNAVHSLKDSLLAHEAVDRQ